MIDIQRPHLRAAIQSDLQERYNLHTDSDLIYTHTAETAQQHSSQWPQALYILPATGSTKHTRSIQLAAEKQPAHLVTMPDESLNAVL